MAVGLVYSTTTGNTETVAGYIAEETGLSAVDIADLTGEAVAAFDGIIVGAPPGTPAPTPSARAPRGTSSSTATSPALTSRARRSLSLAWATRVATVTTSAM